MLYIMSDNTIRLTRGDTARLNVSITNDQTQAGYDISETDELTFSVKKTVNDDTPLLQKVIKGHGVFHIEPADTSGLAFGKYKYDVQIKNASGDVFTIIEPAVFEILAEVSC